MGKFSELVYRTPDRAEGHQQAERRQRAHDPRAKKLVGWELGVPLYELNSEYLPYQVLAAAGTTMPSVGGVNSFSVHVELKAEHPLTAQGYRRVMAQVFRALVRQQEENAAWIALKALGGDDRVERLPWSRPHVGEVHAFWMKRPDYTQPVLALRSHFNNKNVLKSVFDTVHANIAAHSSDVAHSGWDVEAKLWWLASSFDYARVLGLFRQRGFRLKWTDREGFPPAPPIQELR